MKQIEKQWICTSVDIQASAEILGKVVGQAAYLKHLHFNIELETINLEEARSTCIVPK